MNHKLNKLSRKTTHMGKDQTAIATEYAFANAGDRAKTQFLELSRLCDAQTIRHIDDLTLLPDPAVYPGEVSLKVKGAFQQVLNARGGDLRYGRSLPQRLHAHRLLNIGAEASASIWKAGSAGARLVKFSCAELREAIIGSGFMSQLEFEADMKRVDERDFLMPSPMLWTAWGQLP